MRKRKLKRLCVVFLVGLPLAHSLDFEQQLLIENNGLDLTLRNVPVHKSLIDEDVNSETTTSLGEFDSIDPAQNKNSDLSNLLGYGDTPPQVNIDSDLDSLLGDSPDSPAQSSDGSLDSLLDDLNTPTAPEPTGLDSLDALLGTPLAPIETESNDLGRLGLLTADNSSPATTSPGGLSGLDGILGNLGGALEVEEIEIEGLGTEKKEAPKKVPNPKKEKAKKVTEKKHTNTDSKKVKITEKKHHDKEKETYKKNLQLEINPLDRKLIVKSGINIDQLVEKIAKLGRWQLEKSDRFSAISNKKISLSFQNVPLRFLLKWVSTQTGLEYKLKKHTLYI